MTTPDVPLAPCELTSRCPARPSRCGTRSPPPTASAPGSCRPSSRSARAARSASTWARTRSEGTVTGWDPPAASCTRSRTGPTLTGHDDAAVTPLVTEFLVEAKSGGTCVVRVVTSAFGTGADWEQEFFDDMMSSWAPFFDNLRLYLTHFPGQQGHVDDGRSRPSGPGRRDVWSAGVRQGPRRDRSGPRPSRSAASP